MKTSFTKSKYSGSNTLACNQVPKLNDGLYSWFADNPSKNAFTPFDLNNPNLELLNYKINASLFGEIDLFMKVKILLKKVIKNVFI